VFYGGRKFAPTVGRGATTEKKHGLRKFAQAVVGILLLRYAIMKSSVFSRQLQICTNGSRHDNGARHDGPSQSRGRMSREAAARKVHFLFSGPFLGVSTVFANLQRPWLARRSIAARRDNPSQTQVMMKVTRAPQGSTTNLVKCNSIEVPDVEILRVFP
jgi:hypothetical protein